MSEGIFFPSDNVLLPANIGFESQFNFRYSDIYDFLKLKADYNNMQYYDLSSTTFYFPLVYLPQTLGVIIARLFTDRVFIIATVGRAFGYFFNVLLIYFALKMLLEKRELLMLVVFLPIFMQESVSMAGDCVENALIIFTFCYLLTIIFSKCKTKKWLFVLLPLIGMCKMFYLPLVFLVFLIKNEAFSNKTQAIVYKAGLILTTFIMSGLWFIIAMHQPVKISGGKKSGEQVLFIMESPIRYLRIIFKSIATFFKMWIRQLFGGSLGWNTIYVFSVVIYSYVIVIVVFALIANKCIVFDLKSKLIVLGIDLIVFFVVLTTEYISWSEYGGDVITGVQGRYFVPLLFPSLIIILNNNRIHITDITSNKIMKWAIVIINSSALICIIGVYGFGVQLFNVIRGI